MYTNVPTIEVRINCCFWMGRNMVWSIFQTPYKHEGVKTKIAQLFGTCQGPETNLSGLNEEVQHRDGDKQYTSIQGYDWLKGWLYSCNKSKCVLCEFQIKDFCALLWRFVPFFFLVWKNERRKEKRKKRGNTDRTKWNICILSSTDRLFRSIRTLQCG